MKPLPFWTALLLMGSLFLTDLHARGADTEGQRGRPAAGRGNANRSPVTGSRLQRPQPQVLPRPQVQQRPQVRPAPQRPQVRPIPQPQRPQARPMPQRPQVRPVSPPRPVPQPLPQRPQVRPVPQRPNFQRPGQVVYPRPKPLPARPPVVQRPRPGRPPVVTRPPVIQPVQPGRPGRPQWGNQWGRWGNWNRPRPGVVVNNTTVINNVRINRNYYRNPNWSYRPNYWGSRPWWTANRWHTWHHGSWNYGWNRRWYGHHHRPLPRPWPGYVVVERDDRFAEGVAWGLAAWGLGNLVNNLGYQSYSNPYTAPPVRTSAGTTIINYNEPITVAAGKLPPGDEASEDSAEEKAADALAASREQFKRGDYLAALNSADQAIAAVPGDTTTHEYRALVLFALGKYGEAAGVLNPVLASGPGWDWTTMTGLYGSQAVYTGQLRRLEDFGRAVPDDAAVRFLLGYHYLVCGHLDRAYEQFDQAVKLMPADTISAQLRDLCKSSAATPEEAGGEAEGEAPAPATVEEGQLTGTWVSDRGAEGKVTLSLQEDGSFRWSFTRGGETTDLTGSFSIDDRGLLVLSGEDSQMVGEVKLPDESHLNFILSGGPEGDPGLTFNKAG